MRISNAVVCGVCCLLSARTVEGFGALPVRSVYGRPSRVGSRGPSALSSAAAESVGYLRDNLQTPPESIIRAVERAGPNTPLSVGDAAAMSGTDLNTARTNLMVLSSLTGGDLEVTKDGEILYSFPSGVRSILQKRSLGQKVKVSVNFLYPYMLFALRASFGIFLFSSLAIMVSAFVVASSSSSSSEDNNRSGNRRSNIHFNSPSLTQGLFEQFYFRPYYSFYSVSGNRQDYSRQQSEINSNSLSFIESFFSYVFGDGDANAQFSAEQLKYMSAKIRASGGMVVADQLGPYLDPPELNTRPKVEYDGTARSVDSYVVDESWVLPAVLQLGGVPVVTEEGDIVYQFQDLVSSGQAQSKTPPVPSLLFEKQTPFTAANKAMTFFAGGLGFANLIGALWLGRLLGSASMIAREPMLMASLARVYPALFVYAILYNVIPAVRWLLLKRRNEAVRLRNLRREEWASYVLKEPQALKDKIASGRAAVGRDTLSRTIGTGGEGGSVYSTKTDPALESEKRALDAFKDFDNRLM